MRIGITGATGFIGTALGKAAAERGHTVVAFSRSTSDPPPWAKEVRPVSTDEEQPVLDPSGLDALVHLAGENVMGYWTAAKKQRIRDSRVDLTRRVVEALQQCEAPPQTFVCGSAIGVYGDRGDEWLSEASPHGTGFLAGVCVEWESAASRALALGTRVVLLRTGMVLGRGGGAWPMLRRVFSARLGSRLGDGTQWVSWVHLDDEVGIILDALENPAYNGPVNLTAPNPVTNAEMTTQIAGVLDTSTFLPVPAFALKLALGEVGSVVLDSTRVKPAVALAMGYTFKHPELREALAACV